MDLSERSQLNPEAFQALARYTKDSPSWLQEVREPAKKRFLEEGWPHRKLEDWRYTSLNEFKSVHFHWSHAKGLVDNRTIRTFLDPNSLPIVITDGVLDTTEAFNTEWPTGVIVEDLRQAVENRESELKDLILSDDSSSGQKDAFRLLNDAFLYSGVYIRIDPGTVLSQPLQVLFVNTCKPKPYSLYPRVILNVGESASATLTSTHHHVDEGTYLHDGMTQIHLGPNASLKHFTLQSGSPNAYQYDLTQIRLERDSRYHGFNLALGGRLCRQELLIDLDGEGSEATANGAYLTDKKQQIDNYSQINHNVPRCQSSQCYKGILKDQSRAVFSGKVTVARDAQQTNAFQLNKNLLLSNEAEVDTKPQLIIDADDVKCSHGATVGQLQPEQVFYLQSRGIDKDQAQSILARAFLHEILTEVEHPWFKEKALDYLIEWLDAK